MALITGTVLQLSDFTHKFVVDCDASGLGIGAILHQGDYTIAFFSHAVVAHHINLATYELELIGLVQAMRHWWPYPWERSFVVWTDHCSLKFLLNE